MAALSAHWYGLAVTLTLATGLAASVACLAIRLPAVAAFLAN